MKIPSYFFPTLLLSALVVSPQVQGAGSYGYSLEQWDVIDGETGKGIISHWPNIPPKFKTPDYLGLAKHYEQMVFKNFDDTTHRWAWSVSPNFKGLSILQPAYLLHTTWQNRCFNSRRADCNPKGPNYVIDANTATETSPLGTIYKYTKTSRSGGYEISSIRDRVGNQIYFERHSDGRLLSIRDNFSQSISFNYPSDNQISSVQDNAGNTYEVQLISNRLTKVRSVGKDLWGIWYDKLSRVVRTKAPNGGVKKISYDSRGNLRSIINANNYMTVFSYDEQMARAKTIFSFEQENFSDQKIVNHVTREGSSSFSWDSLGRLSQSDFADRTSLILSYQCDAGGMLGSILGTACSQDDKRLYNVTKVERKNGTQSDTQSFIFSCNQSDFVCDLISASGGGVVSIFSYSNHIPTSKTVNGQKLAFSYDANGNATAVTSPFGSITRTFNSDGTLASETDLTGKTTTYTRRWVWGR